MSEMKVRLQVRESSEVELEVQERVQLLRQRDDRRVERHGALLSPGRHALHLAPGVYHFRSLSDAQLRLTAGAAVEVEASAGTKDPIPPPPPPLAGTDELITRGDAVIATARLRVIRAG